MLKLEQDLWYYSDAEGYLTEDGAIRVYGFSAPPTAPWYLPRCARRGPAVLELKPGLYSWCTCGYSATQPFCDNAHRDPINNTNRKSYKFRVIRATKVSLCRCKQTNTPPFCDCTHTKLLSNLDESEPENGAP